jgi:ATP-dependent Clp protease protease subunit
VPPDDDRHRPADERADDAADQRAQADVEGGQPALVGGVRGQASDITIEAEEILKMRERINRVIARETGQPYEKIVQDTDRNFWMSAEEAKAYGMVAKIVNSAAEVK